MNPIAFAALGIVSACVPYSAFAQRESGGRRAPMAVEIRFSSPGNGIFREGFEKAIGIAQAELGAGTLNRFLRSSILGREGERNLCLQFSEYQKALEVGALLRAYVAEDNKANYNRTRVNLMLECVTEARPTDRRE